MQDINLDSENSFFDAVNKSYGNLDYLTKFLNDNGGDINKLPIICTYDDTLNVTKPNYAIKLNINLTPNIRFLRSDGQTEFDVVSNICYDLNNLAKVLNDNNTKLDSGNIIFSIDKNYINDLKANLHLSNNSIRFKTGVGLLSYNQDEVGDFLLQENGYYLLQEDGYKIIW